MAERMGINVSNISDMLFSKAGRRISKPRKVQLFGEPNQWVNTTRHLRVTHERPLTLPTHINQARKKAVERLGMLGPLLNRISGFSISNCVLLHKQLIRHMMDYVRPVWRYAASSHFRKLQVL
jgi:hypothetical protein